MLDATDVALLATALVIALAPAIVLVRRRREAEEADRPARSVEVAATLSVGGGFLLAHAGLVGLPSWGAWEHQPAWVAIAATTAALPFALVKPGCSWGRAVTAATIAAVIGWLVIVPAIGSEWQETSAGVGWLLVLALASAVVLDSTARLAATTPGAIVPVILALTAAGSAALCLASHYAKFALSSFAVAMLIVPAGAVLLFRRRAFIGQGAVLVANALLLALLLGGFLHSLADDRVAAPWFLLAGGAPLFARLVDIGGGQRSLMTDVLRIAATAAAVGVAVIGALAGGAPPAADDGGASGWDY